MFISDHGENLNFKNKWKNNAENTTRNTSIENESMDESILVNQLQSDLSLTKDNFYQKNKIEFNRSNNGEIYNDKANNNSGFVTYASNPSNTLFTYESALTNNKSLSSKLGLSFLPKINMTFLNLIFIMTRI